MGVQGGSVGLYEARPRHYRVPPKPPKHNKSMTREASGCSKPLSFWAQVRLLRITPPSDADCQREATSGGPSRAAIEAPCRGRKSNPGASNSQE